MLIDEAVALVLELARENIIDPQTCNEDDLKAQRARQIEACNTLEDFATNHMDFDANGGDTCLFIPNEDGGFYCWQHNNACPGPVPYCPVNHTRATKEAFDPCPLPGECPHDKTTAQREAVRALWDALSEILESPKELCVSNTGRARALKAIELAQLAFPEEA